MGNSESTGRSVLGNLINGVHMPSNPSEPRLTPRYRHRYLTLPDVARFLRVSLEDMHELVEMEDFPIARIDGMTVVPRLDLIDYLRRCQQCFRLCGDDDVADALGDAQLWAETFDPFLGRESAMHLNLLVYRRLHPEEPGSSPEPAPPEPPHPGSRGAVLPFPEKGPRGRRRPTRGPTRR